ncbi:cell division protein FtsQ [Gemmobacter megaterium]|uniref:Cell division protein FtsQ n=1 Tax=Gemmobacter megaterium TaxID=1086013 RepID=A0A1N7P0S6_9RHOB|nr:cell division protein FtsQ/DivIB [Gemmobacter megaterium]GGE15329.1 cell division protein FtsQ [Gemmobacter megaterium]SIT04146.1 cell division protein FtsQ [Gemmobacter megaterium]
MRPLREAAQRRDPAPSRWAYRWHRLWLTPMFRLTVRVGMPLALMASVAGLWLADEGRRTALHDTYVDLRSQFQNRPEFMVNLVAIEGASPLLAEAIRAGLGYGLPLSSFEIDLPATRARVESYDAVARADVRIVSGGVLQVNVTERLPALVWRAPDGVWLVDAGGHRVAQIGARSLRGDLPLIAGQGAAARAAEALDLVQAAGPLVPRLRGLVRMGERRWDVVLDRDQRLMLPEDNPVRALERLIALDQAEGILARDITAVDLRNDRRPTLRLSAEGADTLRQIRLAQTGG